MLGDYIDRGPHSYRVIKPIMELQRVYGKEQVVLLRGNHEQRALNYFQNGDNNFLYNGGDITIKDFQLHQDDLD